MNSLMIMPRNQSTSDPARLRSRNRRASDRVGGLEARPSMAGPFVSTPIKTVPGKPPDSQAQRRTYPEPDGILLLVQDPTDERNDLKNAARLAGMQVIVARDQGEALEILRKRGSRIDLLFVMPQSSTSSPAAALIRKSLELCPGLRVLTMGGAGGREGIQAAYEAGTASYILQGAPVERVSVLLKQSLSAVRESRRRNLWRLERKERHASESPGRRCLRGMKSLVNAPSGSRRAAYSGSAIVVAVALLIGMVLAVGLERFYRSMDRYEFMTNRLLEGMNPTRGNDDHEYATLLRWQALQQIGLAREANDASRRYYQDHLQELRRQRNTTAPFPSGPRPAPGSLDQGEPIGSEGRASGGGYRRTPDDARW